MGEWEAFRYCPNCDSEYPHWCEDSTAECGKCGKLWPLDEEAPDEPLLEDGEFSLYEVDPWSEMVAL